MKPSLNSYFTEFGAKVIFAGLLGRFTRAGLPLELRQSGLNQPVLLDISGVNLQTHEIIT